MKENDLKMALLKGSKKPIKVGNIQIRQLTLGQIEDFGFEEYLGMIKIITLKKEDIFADIVKIEDNQKMPEISLFELLLIHPYLKECFYTLISLFVMYDIKEGSTVKYVHELQSLLIEYEGEVGMINKSNLEEIFEVIKKISCCTKTTIESQRDDIDDEMAELLKEFEQVEQEISSNKSNEITYFSIIESVSTKHPSYNLFNIWDLTIYQLMSTYYRLEQIKYNENMMNGIYAGTVSTEKLDLESVHWAKELKSINN